MRASVSQDTGKDRYSVILAPLADVDLPFTIFILSCLGSN